MVVESGTAPLPGATTGHTMGPCPDWEIFLL